MTEIEKSENSAQLRNVLKDFFSDLLDEHVAKLANKLDNLTSCSNNDLRAQYSEAGKWARHYSNIRTATTTFLFGIALGLLSGALPDTQLNSNLAALFVWICGVGLFLAFTHFEYKKINHQSRHMHRMKATAEKYKEKIWWKHDVAFWVVCLLSLGFFIIWLVFDNDVSPSTVG